MHDGTTGRRLPLAFGTIAYAAIPGGAAALAVAVLALAGVPVDRPIAALAVALAIGVAAILGRPMTERIAATHSAGDPDDELTVRVDRLAGELGVPTPTVRTVEAGAPNAAVYARRRGEPTLLVSERLLTHDETTGDAVLAAALARANRDAAVTTAFLPVALVVEALVLLGLDLVRDWSDDDEDEDERRFAFGEQSGRDRSGLRKAAAFGGGGLLLLLVAPFWLLLTLGDRFLVGGGRREADRIAAAADRAEPLADYLVDAPDAANYRDWPPSLDRLSVVAAANGSIRTVRGTDRYELRVREARLRTGRR